VKGEQEMIVQPNPELGALATKNIVPSRERARVEDQIEAKNDLKMEQAQDTASFNSISKLRPGESMDVLNATVAAGSESGGITSQTRGSLLDVVA